MRIRYRGYALVGESEPERGWWAWPVGQGKPDAQDAEAKYPTLEALRQAIDRTYEDPVDEEAQDGGGEGGGQG